MRLLIFTLVVFCLQGCLNRNVGPEAAIKDFVETGMGQIVTRDFVLARVTGKMLQSFENMQEEDFNKFADMRNVRSESFKILSKSCQEKKCFITYSVGYATKQDDKKVFASDVKKIAEVVEVDGQWLIADVTNIKTYHEATQPIDTLE